MPSVVAMSGGVDSSVAAALTAERAGQEDTLGISLRLYSTSEQAVRSGRSCCAPDDLYDARRAAAALGIRFYVYDAQERFRSEVIDHFVRSYAQGETPNPCVRCNDQVKFDCSSIARVRLGRASLSPATTHALSTARRIGSAKRPIQAKTRATCCTSCRRSGWVPR